MNICNRNGVFYAFTIGFFLDKWRHLLRDGFTVAEIKLLDFLSNSNRKTQATTDVGSGRAVLDFDRTFFFGQGDGLRCSLYNGLNFLRKFVNSSEKLRNLASL